MEPYLPLIIFALALIFVCIAFWDYQRTQKLVVTGKHTVGTYIGVNREVTHQANTVSMTEYSVIEFRTAEGVPIQIQGRTGTIARARLLGKAVELYYDPKAPQDARVDSFMELWMASIIFGTIGATLLLTTVIIWFLL